MPIPTLGANTSLQSIRDQATQSQILAAGIKVASAIEKSNQLVPFEAPTPAATARKIAPIKKELWNQVLPYRFSLYIASDNGSVASYSRMAQHPKFSATTVTLRLPPSSIRFSIPFAVTVTPTAGGVLEEHNGVVFQPISLQGTTGFFPKRQSAGQGSSTGLLKAANSFAPATSSAIQQLFNSARSVVGSVTGAPDQQRNPIFDPLRDDNLLVESGYYQLHYLANFLIAYHEHKKTKDFSNVRLVFEVPKDNKAYVCAVTNFDYGKDKSEPYLIRYSMSLLAYDLVQLNDAQPPLLSQEDLDKLQIPSPNSQGAVKSVLATLLQTRKSIQAAQNVLLAANTDIQDVMQVYNQAYLSVKSIANVGQDITDFSNTFRTNAATLLHTDFANRLVDVWSKRLQDGDPDARKALGPAGPDQGSVPISPTNNLPVTTPQGETPQAVSNDPSDVSAQRLKTALHLALDNPDVGENISLEDFSLPQHVQESIDTIGQKARQTTQNDITGVIDRLNQTSDLISFATNSMDPDYQKTYGISDPNIPTRQLTEDDIILQADLEEGAAGYERLLATGELYGFREPDPFVAANESLDDTAKLPSPLSAYPVVVERDATIERMAIRHLGSADRALDIIVMNGLRAPYIDEAGFTLALSSIGPRTALVQDKRNIQIGQSCEIRGTGKATVRRRIVNIEDFDSVNYLITFDGDPVLDQTFPSSSNPYVWARLPGTVGSNDTILIPTNQDSGEIPEKATYLNSVMSHAERVFKVDTLLGPGGDVVLDHNGDWARAAGYTNAIQALRIKVETGVGELEDHLRFGLPGAIGTKIDPLQDFNETVRAAVTSDPRFTNATTSATIDGTAERITVQAEGAAGTGLIPVTFIPGQS
jgi:hemin uptake protein HemP